MHNLTRLSKVSGIFRLSFLANEIEKSANETFQNVKSARAYHMKTFGDIQCFELCEFQKMTQQCENIHVKS